MNDMFRALLRPRFQAPYRATKHYERVLGTSMELAVVADDPPTAERAEERAWATIERLERTFSVYRPDSELNRWQASHDEDRTVSRDLAEVLHAAERWRVAFDGAFLPTVESFTRAWRAREQGEAALGFESLHPAQPLWVVDLESCVARRLTRHPASLNALAKGYVLDRAAEAAHAEPGVRQVMLNLGGDLRHVGDGRASVAIADPSHPADNAPPLETIFVSGRGVATSGGYRRGFRVEGRWHSHLLDPADGRPVAHVASVTVVAPNAMDADAMATALSVLGPVRGERLMASCPEAASLIVLSDSTPVASPAWRRLQTASAS